MTLPYVVMTPLKSEDMKTIRFERAETLEAGLIHHTAGGQHSGIIVNKPCDKNDVSTEVSEMQLEFTCHLLNRRTNEINAENRRLKFWFDKGAGQIDRLKESYSFFGDLINPESFPRDYTGFIKKILKQLHGDDYLGLSRVELDIIPLTQLQQEAMVPQCDRRPTELVLRETLQTRLEEAYPNILSMEDLVQILDFGNLAILKLQLEELRDRDLVEMVPLEGAHVGQFGYRRKIHLRNHIVQEMKSTINMEHISTSEKPTIAIVTSLLCEKLAVDAMIEQKTTFVRYKTEGESHVYTIGNVGPHKVISTKLPMVDRQLQAKISSGNITTRLLGAFKEIQHVFLVGVGGSVPHVYEFDKHSRLGDIVVSSTVRSKTMPHTSDVGHQAAMTNGTNSIDSVAAKSVYCYCDRLIAPPEDASKDAKLEFVVREYVTRDPTISDCIEQILDRFEIAPQNCEWAQILNATSKLLNGENDQMDFTRPSPDTDKLKLKISEDVTVEIKHPDIPEDLAPLYPPGVPAVRIGNMGSGRPITDNDAMRDIFAKQHRLLSYDAEYDQVLESVLGNGLDSFVIIRGIADYAEGRGGTQWQSYAALAAASFMKVIILQLPQITIHTN